MSRQRQLKIGKEDVVFIIGVSVIYCSLSAGFSLTSMILPDRVILANPLEHGSLSFKEIIGHFAWGAVAATVALRFRYILLGGLLAVLIDSDHLIGMLGLEGIPRMGHSIMFAIISTVVMMVLFRKSDYRLGAVVGTSILTHISYDIFDGDFGFPVLTPFVNKIIQFPRADWVIFEIAAVAIIGIVSFIVSKKRHPERSELA